MASKTKKKEGCKRYKDAGTRDVNKERTRVRHEKCMAKQAMKVKARAERLGVT